MIGIRCPILYLHHKAVLAEQLDKGIASGHTTSLLEHILYYQIQFGAAQTRVVTAIILCLFYNKRFNGILGKVVHISFVIGLSAITKQPAESAEGVFPALFT